MRVQICGRFGPNRPHRCASPSSAKPDLRSARPIRFCGRCWSKQPLCELLRPETIASVGSVRARAIQICDRFRPGRTGCAVGSRRTDRFLGCFGLNRPSLWVGADAGDRDLRSVGAEPTTSAGRFDPKRSHVRDGADKSDRKLRSVRPEPTASVYPGFEPSGNGLAVGSGRADCFLDRSCPSRSQLGISSSPADLNVRSIRAETKTSVARFGQG